MTLSADRDGAYVMRQAPAWLTRLVGREIEVDPRLGPLLEAAEQSGCGALFAAVLESDPARLSTPVASNRYETFLVGETDAERPVLQAFDAAVAADAAQLSLAQLRDLFVLFATLGLRHTVGQYVRRFYLEFWALPSDDERRAVLGITDAFDSAAVRTAVARDTAWTLEPAQASGLRGV